MYKMVWQECIPTIVPHYDNYPDSCSLLSKSALQHYLSDIIVQSIKFNEHNILQGYTKLVGMVTTVRGDHLCRSKIIKQY